MKVFTVVPNVVCLTVNLTLQKGPIKPKQKPWSHWSGLPISLQIKRLKFFQHLLWSKIHFSAVFFCFYTIINSGTVFLKTFQVCFFSIRIFLIYLLCIYLFVTLYANDHDPPSIFLPHSAVCNIRLQFSKGEIMFRLSWLLKFRVGKYETLLKGSFVDTWNPCGIAFHNESNTQHYSNTTVFNHVLKQRYTTQQF